MESIETYKEYFILEHLNQTAHIQMHIAEYLYRTLIPEYSYRIYHIRMLVPKYLDQNFSARTYMYIPEYLFSNIYISILISEHLHQNLYIIIFQSDRSYRSVYIRIVISELPDTYSGHGTLANSFH